MTSTTTAVAPPEVPTSEPVRRRTWVFWVLDALIVVTLLVTAAVMRARPLAPPSLWLDDAWVSLLWKVDSIEDVRRISVASPGFTAILKLWFNLVGFSNGRAQLPAYFFGILAPPALYFTARNWRLGRAAALLAGGLILISPVHMRYSGRVKAFTMEALAAAVVLLIADRLLSDPGRRSRWYAFTAVAAIATMLSTPLVIVCIPGFAAGFVAARRASARIPRAALGATVAYGLFSIAWYFAAISSAVDRNLVRYWRDYYISHDSVGEFVSTTYRGLTRLVRGFDPAPTVVALLVLTACLLWISRVRPDRAVLLFGPIAIAAGIAFLHRNPIGGGRTDIYLYSNLALIVACGANALFTQVRPQIAGAAVLAAIIGLGTTNIPLRPAYPKEDFRAMLAIVNARLRTEDAILLYPKARFAAALYTDWPFHLRGPIPGASVTTPFDLEIDRPLTFVPLDTIPVRFESTLRRATAASRRIWYLGTHGGPDYDSVEALLSRAGYEIHLRRGFAPHYFLQLWTRPVARPAP